MHSVNEMGVWHGEGQKVMGDEVRKIDRAQNFKGLLSDPKEY